MAGIVFQTSFDHYTTITHRFNSVTVPASASIGAFGRNGTNGLRLVNPNANHRVAKTLPAPLTDIYLGFAYKTSLLPNTGLSRTIAEIRDVGVTQVSMRLHSDGSMRVYRGGTTTDLLASLTGFAMLPNVFYHLALYARISNTVGFIQVRVNEVECANATGLDTQISANNSVSEIVLAHANEATNDNSYIAYFDDVVVRDDDWVNDREVGCYFVTGAGANTDWTPNTGTNHGAISEAAPDGDTTHNATSTPGHKDTFPHQPCSTTAEIDAVIPLMFIEKTDAGTAKVAPVVRHSGTDHTATEEAAPSASSYEYHAPKVYMENPGPTAAWTASDFNAAELGYERTA